MRSLLAALGGYFALLPLLVPQGSLAEDARTGDVLDKQGTALVRPVGRERWTPLRQRDALLPGDQVRTPVRGANAVEIALKPEGRLVVGPGTLVELIERGKVKLYEGEVEVRGDKERPIEVTGPGGFAERIADTANLRVAKGKTARLPKPPRWLEGYRGSTSDEWLGSLIANVDGRNVPLHVGYHKVTVDVRDQIARTTVEESFVNSTNGTLEGVFYFPLPADASISGFGMWIGSELVEADIVERDKARAIYEDILRRRKDPGLLEWAGGNLFKARVFPIFPHSEKRIRIQYTQVLPLEGARLRYRYALRSELLRQHPLQKLEIAVHVSSAQKIAAVASPSHAVRTRTSAHAASAEFSAEEHTPAQDFELWIDVERGNPLTVVPHRRGDDGYFMLLLSPPDGTQGGAWQRDLLPERGPIDVVLLCDTSGSMDAAARRAQAQLVEALLAQLSAKDRFSLAACDVGVHWWQGEPQPVAEDKAEAALAFLAARRSLGWTDLDRAVGEVAKRAKPGQVVVYVGDGIGTTGDADPVALAERLRRMVPGGAHCLTPAATYEQGVLQALAHQGGSLRAIGDDPARTAFELLREVAQPAVKDLRVAFEGLRTARVYPETLPNLAQGTQQVVLGRFLPQGPAGVEQAAQKGQVVVTGRLDGKEVRFRAELALAPGEAGNSFVPRLWARRHLDALLALGHAPAVRDEIVAFSEEFGILTPLTSFLVLETDEDRQQYGVTRRVHMRDGERFFADGRDQARTELRRQQMQVARTWRLDLRRQMLRELATLGEGLVEVGWGEARWQGGAGGKLRRGWRDGLDRGDVGQEILLDKDGHTESEEDDRSGLEPAEELAEADPGQAKNEAADDRQAFAEGKRAKQSLGAAAPAPSRLAPPAEPSLELASKLVDRRARHVPPAPPFGSRLFPGLGDAAALADWTPPASWPAEAVAALRRLDRREAWRALDTALAISARTQARHALRGDETWTQSVDALLGPQGWHARTSTPHADALDQWLAGGERGVLSTGLGLGRKRPAAAHDRDAFPFPWPEQTLASFAAYAGWELAVRSRDGDRVTLAFTTPSAVKSERILVIDTARALVLEDRQVQGGRVTWTQRAEDVVEVVGIAIARKLISLDGEDRIAHVTSIDVRPLAGDAVAAEMTQRLAGHANAIFLGASDPLLAVAKQAVADGKAGFAERLALADHHAAAQQWDRVWEHWQAAEALVAGRPGAAWLRAELCALSRRGPELLALLRERATALAQTKQSPALASHVLALAARALSPLEQLEVCELLRPLVEAAGDAAQAQRRYLLRTTAGLLQQAGRTEEARAAWRAIAQASPTDLDAWLAWAKLLATTDREAAIAGLRAALAAGPWTDDEATTLFYQLSDLLYAKRDLKALGELLAEWTRRAPRGEEAWLRWLSILLLDEKDEAADAWALAELRAPLPARTDHAARARRTAAVRFALGQGWNVSLQQVEPVFWPPLAQVARAALAQGDTQLAWCVLQDWRFRSTDEFADLVQGLRADLTGEGRVETLSAEAIGHYLQFVPVSKTEIDPKVWRDLVDRLRRRFETANAGTSADRAERDALARLVLFCLDGHGEQDEALAFARRRLALVADDASRSEAAGDLLQRLLQAKWSEALEAEVFALVPQVQPSEVDDSLAGREARQASAARTIRQLVKRLEEQRYQALLGEAKDYEKLPRAELRAKQLQARRQARDGLAAALGTWTAKLGVFEQPWLAIERIALAARLGGDVAATHREALALFAATPETTSFDHVLRERCAFVLAWCAAHRSAPQDLAAATLAFLGERVAAATKAGDEPAPSPTDWRHHLVRLYVVLDRPAELLALLETWITPGKVDSRWRIARGYLLAELGRLAEAVQAFEATPQGELGAAELKALEGWLLVLGEGSRGERATRARWAEMPEHALWQRVSQEAQRVARQGDGVPQELDPEVLGALEALFARATYPQNYFWAVTQLYNAGKDFRVLASVCQALVGHTRQQVYPFLEQVGQILQNVHQEATCDELAAATAKLRGAAKTDLDRRALDFFAALIERRAGEVLNQPGPHLERGLAALRRALGASFEPEEAAFVASFLAAMGRIPQSDYAKAQRAELARLHEAAKQGSRERLALAWHRYRTEWTYDERDRACQGFGVALDEVRAADTRRLPAEALGHLQTLCQWLVTLQRFAHAETLLEAEIAAQDNPQLRTSLRQHLFAVWVAALRQGGAVAMGRGEALYEAARKRIEESLWRDGADQIQASLQRFCELHDVAQKKARLPRAGQDLEEFARASLRELASRLPGNGYSLLQTVAGHLRELRGPLAALSLGVDWAEKEPRWIARSGQGVWNQMHWQLAQWRSDAKALGTLEPRLLALVLRELERDLVTLQQQSMHSFCWQHSGHFWAEKRADFVRVADKVVELWPDSPSRQLAVAGYFWNGLGMKERAVDVLAKAGARGKLREAGQWQLVAWLEELRRWGDALPWVDRLVAAVPDRVDYRTARARVLHGLGRGDEARRFLLDSAKLLAAQDRWREAEMAALAACARQCGFHREAVAWFEELIPLHQRTQPGRGIGNGTLSYYYSQIAECYVALGEADQAVDAASAAVVSWGTTHHNRAQAIVALRNVLERIADLDAWAARRAAKVAETGLDAPILRKATGLVWLGRQQPKKALAELRLARELQPDDAEVHAALLQACDALGDAPGACASLLESIACAPRNLDLYLDLGRRLEKLGDAAGAERAFTSLAEALPNEAESHEKLAQERKRQKRLDEAIVQWQQVVRCRKDEPPGWLGLARAQLEAGDHAAARQTLEHLLGTAWHPRFGDVKSEAARLLAGISGSPR